jgi:hypothetical protein
MLYVNPSPMRVRGVFGVHAKNLFSAAAALTDTLPSPITRCSSGCPCTGWPRALWQNYRRQCYEFLGRTIATHRLKINLRA